MRRVGGVEHVAHERRSVAEDDVRRRVGGECGARLDKRRAHPRYILIIVHKEHEVEQPIGYEANGEQREVRVHADLVSDGIDAPGERDERDKQHELRQLRERGKENAAAHERAL